MEIARTSKPPHVVPLWAFQHFEMGTLRKICRLSCQARNPLPNKHRWQIKANMAQSDCKWILAPCTKDGWQKIMLAWGFDILKHYYSGCAFRKECHLLFDCHHHPSHSLFVSLLHQTGVLYCINTFCHHLNCVLSVSCLLFAGALRLFITSCQLAL